MHFAAERLAAQAVAEFVDDLDDPQSRPQIGHGAEAEELMVIG